MIPRSLDLFCHVIDNFGDAGVSLRFVCEFKKKHPGCAVRLFIDNLAALHAIEPSIGDSCFNQDIHGITVIGSGALTTAQVDTLGIAQIVIEAFACIIPDCYLERALFSARLIINLDYLSAETWTEGYHCTESLLSKGVAKKYFYMPGFTAATGGVILNSEVLLTKIAAQSAKISRFEQSEHFIKTIVQRYDLTVPIANETLIGTVFTYERGFDTLLLELQKIGADILLLCFGEKSRRSMEHSLTRSGIAINNDRYIEFQNIRIVFMPFIPQHEYDRLLCYAHFNFVRGEDSLVRALLAGKPFIWNAYLQDEKYQKVKVEALLSIIRPYFDDIELFQSFRQLHLHFNDAPCETPQQCTMEDFNSFFANLKKIEHSINKLCYFIERNCNLIEKISDFINAF